MTKVLEGTVVTQSFKKQQKEDPTYVEIEPTRKSPLLTTTSTQTNNPADAVPASKLQAITGGSGIPPKPRPPPPPTKPKPNKQNVKLGELICIKTCQSHSVATCMKN